MVPSSTFPVTLTDSSRVLDDGRRVPVGDFVGLAFLRDTDILGAPVLTQAILRARPVFMLLFGTCCR